MTARIILTIIGLFFAGPIGAIVGFFIGLFLDRAVGKTQGSSSGFGWQWRQMLSQPFVRSTFILMGYLAKADGQITSNEITIASNAMAQFRLSDEQRHQAMRWFYDGKNQQFEAQAIFQQLRFYRHTPFMRILVSCLMNIAYANGAPSAEQQRLLQEIFTHLDIVMPGAQQSSYSSYTYGNHQSYASSSSGGSLAQAYQELGVKSDADVATVRKAYRRLLNKNHPDKLAAKGATEKDIKAASERTIKIRQAYENIMRSRGEVV